LFSRRTGWLSSKRIGDGDQALKRILAIVMVVAVSLVLAGASAGGNAVVTGHSAAPPVTSNLGTTGGGSTPSSTAGTLPFTGIDLAGITVVAALLLGGGLTLRRTARKQR
jgi:hypothetical protein